MKFRELLNEEFGEVVEKNLSPIREKFKKDVLGINEGIPGLSVEPMTDDDLNPEGVPANVQPDDAKLEEDDIEAIEEEEEIEEDIQDAEVKDMPDELLDDLLDSIAKTDKEKKEVENNRNEFIKQLKTVTSSPEEFKKEIEKYDEKNKFYGAKDSETGEKSIADRLDKIIHRSTITTIGIDPESKDPKSREARFLKRKGIEMEKDMKRLTKDQFASLIKKRPSEILGQNAKMKVSGGEKYKFVDISLPAYQGIIVDEKTGKFKIIKTCPGAKGCKVFCYASKGNYTMFPAVALKAASILNYLWNDFDGFVSQLKGELATEQKGDYDIVMRWHDAGDIISESYLDMMIDIAKDTPEVIHYAYTKRLAMIDKREGIPDNLHFTKSFGGKEDDLIDLKRDKTSQVVLDKIFGEFEDRATKSTKMIKKKTSKAGKVTGQTVTVFEFQPDDMKEIKKRVAEEFNMPLDTIITYDELMKIPYDNKAKHTQKWNVLVFHGHGDDAGMRKDVKTVMLFIH